MLLDELTRAMQEVESSANSTSQRVAGVYIISVAARLARMHPQTLRKYDREDLVNPARTGGMLRLYSEEDVQRLLVIGRLVDEFGLNVEGVRLVLSMVGVMQEVIEVLERSSEVAGTRTARLASQELSRLIDHIGQGEPSSHNDPGTQ
ncbi:MAG: MerR family transcriptional regulator [Dehalococcoidia bacterium]|nr:MerR family transcriptional regulator [Dehalococcoidia bacterium]MSQ34724.1 MerR family transcriptional regulator [Dehalococcoidia bacterium]